MNIKGLLGPNVMPQVRSVEKVNRTIQSDASHDRDANGQQARGDEQKEKPPMSEEMIQQALEHLKQLPMVKEHRWTVDLFIAEDLKKFVIIKDNLGNLIRRIPEADLWTLPLAEPTSKGHLFKKTA